MRPKRSDNKYWTGTRNFNHLQYESDLEDYISDLEVENEHLHKLGVMQGCQCKDRIGETTVWCCNQCGLPCEEGWLPTYKPVRQPTVASEGEEKCVSDGHDETHVTIKDGDFEWCMACSRQVKRA